MEDKKIAELFKLRDEKAVEELLKQYGKLFRNLAFKILNNSEDTEECINDTLLEVWNSIPPAEPSSIMAFSCKIVRRLAINKLKYNLRQKRNADVTLSLDELSQCISSEGDVLNQIEKERLHKILNDFLRELDEETRALFISRYFYFESIKELSERFGKSENKLSVKLYRTREKLAKLLKKEGIYE